VFATFLTEQNQINLQFALSTIMWTAPTLYGTTETQPTLKTLSEGPGPRHRRRPHGLTTWLDLQLPSATTKPCGTTVKRNGGWAKDGVAEEPARVAGASAAGREGTRRSEKAKVSEEALLTRSSKAKKTMNA